MRPPSPLGPSVFARWTSRIALFSVGVLATAILLHRLLSLPTPVALNLVVIAMAGALLSLLFSIFASVGIWRTGRPGTPRIVFACLLSLGLLAWPLVYLPTYQQLPKINDLTTDPASPPQFETLAKMRQPGANPVAYPGAAFAMQQAKAYPDIKPIEVDRSADEVFELVADAARRLKLDVVRTDPPDLESGRPGEIEAQDRTLIVGFYDDVAIRVSGNDDFARVDVRSASRYGQHDMGRNAERMRLILKEIVVRLESVVPAVRTKPKAEPAEPRRRRSSRRRRRR